VRRVEFTCSAGSFGRVLDGQPNPGAALRAAVVACFAALETLGPDDEREWRVVAELGYPDDFVCVSIKPTGRVVRVVRAPALINERGV
jgi:hypothetical protein